MRTVLKIEGGVERQLRMAELRKGDKFRLVTDDPTDGVFGREHVIYTAGSDARESKHSGVWEIEVADQFDSTATRLCAS